MAANVPLNEGETTVLRSILENDSKGLQKNRPAGTNFALGSVLARALALVDPEDRFLITREGRRAYEHHLERYARPLPDEFDPLNTLRDRAFAMSKDKGFHEEAKSIGDYIALMHSELSEALEDHRAGRKPDESWYEGFEDDGPLPLSPSAKLGRRGELRKPCGIPSEMADVIIRALDFCGAHNIDIAKAVREKMAYNATRPHRHGGKKL